MITVCDKFIFRQPSLVSEVKMLACIYTYSVGDVHYDGYIYVCARLG